MTRVSPPDEAREFPGPQASRSTTRAPRRTRWRAVQPPNAPAPTTATRGFADAAAAEGDRRREACRATSAAPPFRSDRRVRPRIRSGLLESLDVIPGQDAHGDHLVKRRTEVFGRGAPGVLQYRAAHSLVGLAGTEAPEVLETLVVDLHAVSGQAISRAMRKAAPAARPPMSVVCQALRPG